MELTPAARGLIERETKRRRTGRRRAILLVAVLLLAAAALWLLGQEAAGHIGLVLSGAAIGYGLRMTEEGAAPPQG
jgi:hypothetical protein